MDDIKNFYPEFVPNQVLTDKHLNQLRVYLEKQEQLTRIRLIGMGIVCGLTWERIKGPAPGIIVSAGFGITSDGYLIELPDSTYTHFRAYKDPDLEQDKTTPRYEAWQNHGDKPGQLDIIELLDTKDAEPLAADTGEGRVLVLYLEREPVDLPSCLVTDCNNKGLNINLNVRALLVPKDAVQKIQEGAKPPELARVPRLHTKIALEDIASVADLNKAYGMIVSEVVGPLLASIGSAFKLYGAFLDIPVNQVSVGLRSLEENIDKLVNAGQVNQYHYDLLKDLSCAYNEAVTAACELITVCCPVRDFPRHLMLGVMDDAEGYRNEFAPSPVRNVMHGDLQRVRKLFERIIAMVKGFDTNLAKDVRITPSHTELHSLGTRALPFYYYPGNPEARNALRNLWQPKLRCTGATPWSYQDSAENKGLDHDYNHCTLLRIEGHLGGTATDAVGQLNCLKDLEKLRREHNLEFGLLRTDLEDRTERARTLLEKGRELDAKTEEIALKFQNSVRETLKKTSLSDAVSAIVEMISEQDKLVSRKKERGEVTHRWIQLRCGRRFYCDTSQLEADYRAERSEMLEAIHKLAGRLQVWGEAIDRLKFDQDAAGRLNAIDGGVRRYLLAEALSSAVLAWISAMGPKEPAQEAAKKLESCWKAVADKDSAAVLFAARLACAAAAVEQAALGARALPNELCGFDFEQFIGYYKRASRAMTLFWLCYAALGWALVGNEAGVTVLTPAGAWNSHQEENAVAALLAELRAGFHARLGATAVAYERVVSEDPSVFAHLANRHPGLEHLAGVEKGGTFCLICERDQVVADFSLAGRVPCCCGFDSKDLCLPQVQLPHYAIVLFDIKDGKPQMTELDVGFLVSEIYDVNSAAETPMVRLDLPDKSQLGAKKSEFTYRYDQPEAGAIDRIAYTIEVKSETCPETESGEILVLLLPRIEPEIKTGAIEGGVFYADTGGAAAHAKVRLDERGQETTANEKARYRFENLPGSTYTLRATLEDRASDPTRVTVGPGQTASADLRLLVQAQPGRIGVAVFDKGTKKPLVDAQVALVRGETAVKEAKTNADGRALLAEVKPGSYTLAAGKDGYWPESVQVELASGAALEHDFGLAKVGYHIPESFTNWVKEKNQIAIGKVPETYDERAEKRYEVFQKAGEDSTIRASQSYQVSEAFFRTVLQGEQISDTDAAKLYEKTAKILVSSINESGAGQKSIYQHLLAAATLAILDLLSLTRPGKLTADDEKVLNNSAKLLKTAEINLGNIAKEWNGKSLSEDFAVESAMEINKIFGPSPRRRRGPR